MESNVPLLKPKKNKKIKWGGHFAFSSTCIATECLKSRLSDSLGGKQRETEGNQIKQIQSYILFNLKLFQKRFQKKNSISSCFPLQEPAQDTAA